MSNTVMTAMDSRGVTTITLNRADKHNAFDQQMVTELIAALENTQANPNARILIIAAEGMIFSAGADLHWMKHMGECSYEDNLNDARMLAKMLKALYEIPLPTIAKIQGAAFGGALGLISCCDIAIAATDSLFAFSEVKIGLIPATISPYILEAIGSRAARRYFITGQSFDAQQALLLGMIHDVVEQEHLENTVARLIDKLLKNSPKAMASSKQLIREITHHHIDDTLINYTCERIATARLSKEGQVGLSAFIYKRKAYWQRDNKRWGNEGEQCAP